MDLAPENRRLTGMFYSLEMRGADTLDFAHRIFTRNIKSLASGRPTLCGILSRDAKLEALFWVIKSSPESLQLIFHREEESGLRQQVERFHFSERVEMSASKEVILETLGDPTAPESASFLPWRGTGLALASSSQGPSASAAEWNIWRISNLFFQRSLDFSDSPLLFETGLTDICDENKGCYPGQEIVERFRTRGGQSPFVFGCVTFSQNPTAQEKLSLMEGSNPASGETRSIGQLTKSVASLDGSRNLRVLAICRLNRKEVGVGKKVVAENSKLSGEISALA